MGSRILDKARILQNPATGDLSILPGPGIPPIPITGGGLGTLVIANPELDGNEAALKALQVGLTRYRVDGKEYECLKTYNHYANIELSEGTGAGFEYEFDSNGLIKVVGGKGSNTGLKFNKTTMPAGKYIIFYYSEDSTAFFSGGDIRCFIKKKSDSSEKTYSKSTIPNLVPEGNYEIHYKNVHRPYYEMFVFESSEEFTFQLGFYENATMPVGSSVNVGLIKYSEYNYNMKDTRKYLLDGVVRTVDNAKAPLYVSSTGNDNNDGLTELTPIKTIPDTIKGKAVYLKSGDTFLRHSPVTLYSDSVLTTYGGKAKAVISGEVTTANPLTEYSEGYYFVSTEAHADSGYIRLSGKNEKNNWHRMNETLVTYNADGSIASHPLTEDGEWIATKYTDDGIEKYAIVIKSSVDLTGKYVSYQSTCHGIRINTDMSTVESNISVSNIEIVGYAYHGIASLTVTDVEITDLYIHDIGGGWLSYGRERYGNGIQLWCIGNKRVHIKDCIIKRCYDTAITPQVNASTITKIDTNSEDILIENCYLADSTWLLEFFGAKTAELTVPGYKIDGCIFRNIFLENAMDLTDGRRFSVYSFSNNVKNSSLIQLWDTDTVPRNVDNIVFENIVGLDSDATVLGAKASKIQNGISFNNVKLIYDEDKLKHTGSDPWIIGVATSSKYSGQAPSGIDFIEASSNLTSAEYAVRAYYRSIGNTYNI